VTKPFAKLAWSIKTALPELRAKSGAAFELRWLRRTATTERAKPEMDVLPHLKARMLSHRATGMN
jgi:hypothetical protein